MTNSGDARNSTAGLHMRLGRWFFPALPADYATKGPSLEELTPTYRRWDYLELPLLFLATPVMTFVWEWLLMPLYQWNATRYEPAVFHFSLPSVAMFTPAFFLGILSVYPIYHLVYKSLLGERLALYERYYQLKIGFDNHRAAKPFLCCVIPLCVGLVLAVINWHTVFYRDEIRFHSWLGLASSTYRYSDIKDIRTARQFRAPIGNLVQRREWLIEFADGTQWKTSHCSGLFNLTNDVKAAAMNFVSERSGRPIRELAVLE